MVTTAKKSRSSRKPARGKEPSPKSMAERAYEEIKHRIIILAYKPGEYLNETQVSDELNLGRTPVHQAMSRLMLEGMVEIIPRKGIIVKPLGLNEIMEIIDVRLINEPHAARLAATFANESEIETLGHILDEAEKVVPQTDVEKQMLLDKRFHGVISAAAKNKVLADFLKRLHERSLRFWFVSLRNSEHHAEVVREHRRIFETIKAHDPQGAADAIRDHIESFRRTISRQV